MCAIQEAIIIIITVITINLCQHIICVPHFVLTCADSEAPVFSFCPEGINFATGTNGSYAIPTWPMPNVTDNSGDVTLTSDYSDEPLAVGSTTLITYTALDPSSNMQTCSFNVNITGE